ncbi:ComF family protein [Chelatococcus asaccharovorans]|uniref:ComF family protein n=1 Tax=Chelatococcus asaccharovorans TaxID=28210 RepID=A0A2V3UKU6_9HYPH|nr:ComF family protein [Chelatococcus asaccharovorans]MBS7706433.1 ComF family protein [Chelatococcus asaccharovorans]PXW64924.1 ComF family protein [Chelatococcus asaccharovorans]CAH1661909.1 Competence protein F [Chelatococcus asaccharovorans]CAH1683329.1 Competence protein F [Chelatococcus asaccharovorans]
MAESVEIAGRGWLRHSVAVLQGETVAAASRLAGLIYPPTCIACGCATAEPHGVCAACWRDLPFITRPYCERLGTPFAVDLGGPLLSPSAIADPPVFERARAVARYDGTARELVHRLKYGDRPELAKAMGRMMASAGAELVADAALVVPVPLHPWRLWSRRFNQAMALSREVARHSGLRCDGLVLHRRKSTRPQVGLTRAERAANLQGAFHVPDNRRLLGERVILVDDVLTTGATANAASRALLRGGASSVDVLTFARVVAEV